MSVQIKKKLKNFGKTLGIVFFALLMFTNIKVALMNDTDLANGNVSILGIEFNLFEATAAYSTVSPSGYCLYVFGNCDNSGGSYCGGFIINDVIFTCYRVYYT